jgi:hypothetical protein
VRVRSGSGSGCRSRKLGRGSRCSNASSPSMPLCPFPHSQEAFDETLDGWDGALATVDCWKVVDGRGDVVFIPRGGAYLYTMWRTSVA